MYRESYLTGSYKTGIHLQRSRMERPGRLSEIANMKPTKSCLSCRSAGAVLHLMKSECAMGSKAFCGMYNRRIYSG